MSIKWLNIPTVQYIMAINNQVAQQTTAHLDDRLFEIERTTSETNVHLYRLLASKDRREVWCLGSWITLFGVYASESAALRKTHAIARKVRLMGGTGCRMVYEKKELFERPRGSERDLPLFLETINANPCDVGLDDNGQYYYWGIQQASYDHKGQYRDGCEKVLF